MWQLLAQLQTPDFPYSLFSEGVRKIGRLHVGCPLISPSDLSQSAAKQTNKGCWERLTHNALRNNFSAVLISRLPRWRKKISLFPVYQVLLAFSEQWKNNRDVFFCLLVLSVIKTIAG